MGRTRFQIQDGEKIELYSETNSTNNTADATLSATANGLTIGGTKVVVNALDVNGGQITNGSYHGTEIAADHGGTGLTSYAVGDLLYASATTPTISKLSIGAAGKVLVSDAGLPIWSDTVGSLIVTGNLTVNGVTTSVNSTEFNVDDKNITLGSIVAKTFTAKSAVGSATLTSVSSVAGLIIGELVTGNGINGNIIAIDPVAMTIALDTTCSISNTSATTCTAGGPSDYTADGGGITLKGDTDKIISWNREKSSWDFNQSVYISDILMVDGVGESQFASNIQISDDRFIHPATYRNQDPYTGYCLGQAGSTFGKISANEMHVKSFIADIEQALVGGQIIAKSVAKLYQDFDLGTDTYFIVENIMGFTGAVFVNGDYVRMRISNMTGSAGANALTVVEAWGTVTLATAYGTNGFDSTTKTQAYVFTKFNGTSSTHGIQHTYYQKGSLVLDYGTSGCGILERVAISASGAKPYDRIATWTTTPYDGLVTRSQIGDLSGITPASLNSQAAFSSGTFGIYTKDLYAEGNTYVAGNIWALSGGFGGSVASPVVSVSDYGLRINNAGIATSLRNNSIMIGNVTEWNNLAVAHTGTATTCTVTHPNHGYLVGASVYVRSSTYLELVALGEHTIATIVDANTYTINCSAVAAESITITLLPTNAIRLSKTGTESTSGLFGYTSTGNESFALRLNGTASIAGFDFNSTCISTSGKSALNIDAGIYIGSLGIALGETFSVTAGGVLRASSGTIGDWEIGTGLYSGARTSVTDVENTGTWIGTDGIAIGTSNIPSFRVTAAGALFSTSGGFGGTAGSPAVALSTSGLLIGDSTGTGGAVGADGWREAAAPTSIDQTGAFNTLWTIVEGTPTSITSNTGSGIIFTFPFRTVRTGVMSKTIGNPTAYATYTVDVVLSQSAAPIGVFMGTLFQETATTANFNTLTVGRFYKIGGTGTVTTGDGTFAVGAIIKATATSCVVADGVPTFTLLTTIATKSILPNGNGRASSSLSGSVGSSTSPLVFAIHWSVFGAASIVTITSVAVYKENFFAELNSNGLQIYNSATNNIRLGKNGVAFNIETASFNNIVATGSLAISGIVDFFSKPTFHNAFASTGYVTTAAVINVLNEGLAISPAANNWYGLEIDNTDTGDGYLAGKNPVLMYDASVDRWKTGYRDGDDIGNQSANLTGSAIVTVGSTDTFGATKTWNGAVIGVGYGGTGVATVAAGALLYGSGSGATAINAIPIGSSGYILKSTGTAPAWDTVNNIFAIVRGEAVLGAGGGINQDVAYTLTDVTTLTTAPKKTLLFVDGLLLSLGTSGTKDYYIPANSTNIVKFNFDLAPGATISWITLP